MKNLAEKNGALFFFRPKKNVQTKSIFEDDPVMWVVEATTYSYAEINPCAGSL